MLFKVRVVAAALPLVLLLGFGADAAPRQDVVIKSGNASSLPPNLLDTAKPYRNPLPPPRKATISVDAVTSTVFGARGGSVSGKSSALSGRAYGSFGVPYTSTRVQEGTADGTQNFIEDEGFLAATYPYSTVGKLTFAGGYCSASLIRRSVVVTAAHCIQNFHGGNVFFGPWQYTPSYYDPPTNCCLSDPYLTWDSEAFVRPASWGNGTDIGNGAARDNDLALIAIAPQGGFFVGDYTGFLGYGWNNYGFIKTPLTGRLRMAATTTLGYPGLLDGGKIMQRNDGPSMAGMIAGAGQLWQGSDFTAGSSGGPWVVNFGSVTGDRSGGAVLGHQSTMSVVGVTSWGSVDPNGPKNNYSSAFRQNSRYPNGNYGGYGAGNIGSLMQTLCSTDQGGGQTYAQLGYCDGP